MTFAFQVVGATRCALCRQSSSPAPSLLWSALTHWHGTRASRNPSTPTYCRHARDARRLQQSSITYRTLLIGEPRYRYSAAFCSLCRWQQLSSSWDGGQFGHNRHGPKSGGCCAPFPVGSGSPSNTMWPGPRPTSVLSPNPSNRLATIHQRYRQTRQTDNGPITQSQPFYKRWSKNDFMIQNTDFW